MPISPEHAGRTYPPAPVYRVSAAKIAEFSSALGESVAAHASSDAVAPPTFAAVIAAHAWAALFDDPELGLALHRTMHADQQFQFVRPLRDGDDVIATLTVERVRNRGRLDMITVLVDLAVDGSTVCTARSTLMHTQEAPNV